MFENIDKKYLSVTKFFEQIINSNNRSVPNSIILHGPDITAQYYFALLLARGANCSGSKKQDCECQNCRWIRANEHPEILTISKINSKPDGDDSKSVISIKQINMIKDNIVVSSDYHRFFIFCDAEIREKTVDEENKINNFKFLNQQFPGSNKESWIPLGLTNKCFSGIVANALLKSVEEPPDNVTFIFLTENIENIISTIVSRSQVYYVPGECRYNCDYDYLIQLLSDYPNIDRKKAIIISDFLLKYSKDKEKSLTEIVMSIQTYLKDMLKKNTESIYLKQSILKSINNLQETIIMLKSNFKEQTVADEIAYILTK